MKEVPLPHILCKIFSSSLSDWDVWYQHMSLHKHVIIKILEYARAYVDRRFFY